MKLIYSLLIFSVFSPLLGRSQSDYLGHKHHIDLSVGAHVPLLSGSFKQIRYRAQGEQMKASKDWLDYGMELNVQRIRSGRKSFGFILGMQRFETDMPDAIVNSITSGNKSIYRDSIGLRMQNLRCMNLLFAPRIEWASRQGSAGIGLCYDFSVGFTRTNGRDGTYAYSINQSGNRSGDEGWTQVDYIPIEFKWKASWGVLVQTGIKMRVPLTDRSAWMAGFRYTVIYNIKPSEFEGQHAHADIFSNSDSFFRIQRENLFQINFETGYCFYF